MKKLIFILAGIGLLSSHVQAESLKEAVRKCGQVQNSLKRLVCYDGVVKQLERYTGLEELMAVPAPLPAGAGTPANRQPGAAANTLPQQPVIAAPAPQGVISTPEQSFGMEQQVVQQQSLEKIVAKVVEVTKNRFSKMYITLDNGHVWHQTDESTRFKIKEGDEVYIERGVLGSFYMGTEGKNTRIRVTRKQ